MDNLPSVASAEWKRFVSLCQGLTPEQLRVVSAWIELVKATRGLTNIPSPAAFPPRRLGTGPFLKVI